MSTTFKHRNSLPDRLRRAAFLSNDARNSLLREAAHEIERLRREVATAGMEPRLRRDSEED